MNKTLSSVFSLVLAASLFLSLQACGSQRTLVQSAQTPVTKAADRDYSIAPDDPSGFVVLTDVVPDQTTFFPFRTSISTWQGADT